MTTFRRVTPRVLALTVVWVLLNGEPTVANILGGLVVSLVVLLAFPLADPPAEHRLHPWGALRFAVFVVWSLVTSSIHVVVTSLAPTPTRLRSGIVRVELPGATALVTSLVANSITLTPGTLTVAAEADPAVIYVHALGLGDVEEFRASILDIQRRATAALTPLAPEPTR